MGVKEIASWLNNRGFRNRRGNLFYTGTVHVILTRDTYTGVHFYNQHDSRTRRPRPREDWIAIQVPQIIPIGEFQIVQKRLYARRPNVTPPRISNSEVLLIRFLMLKEQVGYRDLVKMLNDAGVEENERNLRNKVSKGEMQATQFMICLKLLGGKQISIEDLPLLRRDVEQEIK
jgi:hypothetical protein